MDLISVKKHFLSLVSKNIPINNVVDEIMNIISKSGFNINDIKELITFFEYQSNKYNSSQLAYKRAGNGMYGYLGTNMSHIYLAEVAEAITSQGVEFITRVQLLLEKKGYVIIYGDTDSMFILADDKIPDDIRGQGDEVIKKWIREVFVKEWLYGDIANEMDNMAFDIGIPKGAKHYFEFKQEIIAKRGLFLKSKQSNKEYAKKRYILWIVDEEGVPKDELFMRGVEIRRSELNNFIKDNLEKWLVNLMKSKKDYKELLEDLLDIKKMIIEVIDNKEVSKISRYISITKSMDKYDDSMTRIRAAKFWNKFFADGEDYPFITEGDKTMICNVKIKERIDFKNIAMNKDDFLKIYNMAVDENLTNLTFPNTLTDNKIPSIIWDIFELDKELILEKIFYENIRIYLEMMGYSIDTIKYGVVDADDLI